MAETRESWGARAAATGGRRITDIKRLSPGASSQTRPRRRRPRRTGRPRPAWNRARRIDGWCGRGASRRPGSREASQALGELGHDLLLLAETLTLAGDHVGGRPLHEVRSRQLAFEEGDLLARLVDLLAETGAVPRH